MQHSRVLTSAEALARRVHGALPDLAAAIEAATEPDALDGMRAAFALLAEIGALTAVLPARAGGCGLGTDAEATVAACTVLRRLGRADLSLARLYEGHMNAVRLIEVHGDASQIESCRAAVRRGAVLGVWGADGAPPLTLERASGGWRLRGAKRFASGLGIVSDALLTGSGAGEGPQLVLVPAGETARHRPGEWTASAMRASRSGGFDADGLDVGPDALIGGPGSLLVEPWFEGGIWRYCAAHVGGAEAVAGAVRDALERSGRLDHPVQRARLGRMLAAADAARCTVEAAAVTVEAAGRKPADVSRAVARALLARETTEAACTEILRLSERALGMAAHDGASRIDRVRRDLSLFLRQAAPDAKLDRAAETLAAFEPGEAW